MTEIASSDIAFTHTVKSVQSRRGSRRTYARMEAKGGFRTEVTSDLVQFLSQIDTAYLATTNGQNQPYAQHRGGPRGFIRVVDQQTLGFADYSGNRQYVTTGNLLENDKAFLFLMDYAQRRRIKLWGRARVVEGDEELNVKLMPLDYSATVEQAILFTIEAWDVNCPQHIPQKVNVADIAETLTALRQRVAELEAENARLLADAKNGD